MGVSKFVLKLRLYKDEQKSEIFCSSFESTHYRIPSNIKLTFRTFIFAFLFLNHFPFLLKSIKIAIMNISLIFTNRNAITAITFFCYSVSVKLSLLSVYFSITAILFCRKFQTGHAINSPVS